MNLYFYQFYFSILMTSNKKLPEIKVQNYISVLFWSFPEYLKLRYENLRLAKKKC